MRATYLFLLVSTFCFGQRTKTLTDYVSDYNAAITVEKEVETYNADKISAGSGDMYWLDIRYITAAMEMWAVTGNNSYLDRALDMVEGKMATSETCSVIRTNYTLNNTGGYNKDVNNSSFFNDSYKTWVQRERWTSDDPFPTGGQYQLSSRGLTETEENWGKEYNLDQNNGMRGPAILMVFMKHSPQLLTTGNYRQRYDDLVQFVTDQREKWYTRALAGSDALRRTKTYMSSHFAFVELCLYMVTGDPKHKVSVDAWFNDMSTGHTPGSTTGSWLSSLTTHADGGYVWSGNHDGSGGATDWVHASASLHLTYWAYKWGMGYTGLNDMNKFAIAVKNRYFKDSTKQWFLVSGSGSDEDYDIQALYGALLYAEFDENILEQFEGRTSNGAIDSSYMGAQAYTTAILDGNQMYYPEVPWQVGPIETIGDPDKKRGIRNSLVAQQ